MGVDGKKSLFQSFEDRRFAVAVGFFCLVYLGIMYLPDNRWIAKILPFWPPAIFAGIAVITFAVQIFVWKLFRHFYSGWWRHFFVSVLFICEFGLLLFFIMFISWPVFGLYKIFTAPMGLL